MIWCGYVELPPPGDIKGGVWNGGGSKLGGCNTLGGYGSDGGLFVLLGETAGG